MHRAFEIRSCAKLAYEHAQGFIDEPDRKWRADELPEITGGWKPQDLVERVLNLQKMARITRAMRFKHGALRLDQVLSFPVRNKRGLCRFSVVVSVFLFVSVCVCVCVSF